MNFIDIRLDVRVYYRLSPKETYKLMKHDTHSIATAAQSGEGSVTFSTDMTVPDIFGSYSSIRVSVGISVPANTAAIRTTEDLAQILDSYSDIVAEYAIGTINKAFTGTGKPAPFGK